MDFKALFKKRRQREWHWLLRHLKYIMNDHLLIALLFILGALVYYYAGWLAQKPEPSVALLLLWSALGAGLLQFGHLRTYFTGADIHYLTPLEPYWQKYFQAAYCQSLALPSLVLFLFGLASWPFLNRVFAVSGLGFFLLLFCLLSLKALSLLSEWAALTWQFKRKHTGLLSFFLAFFLLALFLAYGPMWGLGALLLFTILSLLYYRPVFSARRFAFLRILDREKEAEDRLRRFLAIFIDLPQQKIPSKRRKIFDVFLIRAEQKPEALAYLFSRHFWRGPEYVLLWLRLTLLGVVLLALLPLGPLALLVLIVFTFLSQVQLLPLGKLYRQHPLILSAPLEEKDRPRAFRHFLWRPLALQVFIFLIVFILRGAWFWALLAGVCDLLFVGFFIKIYLPWYWRLK